MPFFSHPQSFASRQQHEFMGPAAVYQSAVSPQPQMMVMMGGRQPMPPHSSHPDFAHLVLLVFEAVLEVVFVALPGYIVARQGLFDADAQKFVANLNVMVFTPCLVFTKLASQLTAEKLLDLGIIPLIFIVQTLVSYASSMLISKAFGFKKRPQNFVVAMGVFGNSNSLPISLILSLSKTISGLHWDQIPGDNDDEVAARGILYLLIFQQLGQLLRWTWGYNVLLKPKEAYEEEENDEISRVEEGVRSADDDSIESSERTQVSAAPGASGEQTPLLDHRSPQTLQAVSLNCNGHATNEPAPALNGPPANGNIKSSSQQIAEQSDFEGGTRKPVEPPTKGLRKYTRPVTQSISAISHKCSTFVSYHSTKVFQSLPPPLQTALAKLYAIVTRFLAGLWSFMNPPLWAMLAALVVASVPTLQHLFFDHGTFVNNSVTRAVAQSGAVAVPLILVVLGANLARNTLPREAVDPSDDDEDAAQETKLLVACIVSRMLLPTLIMVPILAVVAKFVPVSIVDDPIFVIVVFLLTGAPSALQLAQICQINNVYMGAMSKLLFQSYVVWIMPSTLVLVMCALEVVEWAQAG